jgi:hypothetical protein
LPTERTLFLILKEILKEKYGLDQESTLLSDFKFESIETTLDALGDVIKNQTLTFFSDHW